MKTDQAARVVDIDASARGFGITRSEAIRQLESMANRGDIPATLDIRPKWRNPMHTSRAAAADAGSKVLDKMPWLAETEVGMELVGLSRDQIKRAQAELRRSQGRSALEALRKAAGVVPEG